MSVHTLGKLYKGSGKFKNLFLTQYDENVDLSAPNNLKPICPTRWLSRDSSLQNVIKNYSSILDALEKAKRCASTDLATQAKSLHKDLFSSKCVHGLLAARPIIRLFTLLNKSLQSSSAHVDGMMSSIKIVTEELTKFRTSEYFSSIFNEAVG